MVSKSRASITFRNVNMSVSDVETLMRGLNRHGVKATSGKTHVCPRCDHVLAIAEVVEKYCAACGDVEPREVRA